MGTRGIAPTPPARDVSGANSGSVTVTETDRQTYRPTEKTGHFERTWDKNMTSKKQQNTDKAWGMGFSVGRHKDVFLYDFDTRMWWVDVRTVGAFSMFMAKTVRVCEGKNYIAFDDALSLSSPENAQKLTEAKARLEASPEWCEAAASGDNAH
jgi:hypothetical protein